VSEKSSPFASRHLSVSDFINGYFGLRKVFKDEDMSKSQCVRCPDFMHTIVLLAKANSILLQHFPDLVLSLYAFFPYDNVTGLIA
jgi:hypothetical protein